MTAKCKPNDCKTVLGGVNCDTRAKPNDCEITLDDWQVLRHCVWLKNDKSTCAHHEQPHNIDYRCTARIRPRLDYDISHGSRASNTSSSSTS
eukprot:5988319-Amphidinium_carterae.2